MRSILITPILACKNFNTNVAIWFMSVSLLLLNLRFLVISRRLLISVGLWYCIIARIVCTQLVLFVYRLLWYLDNHSNHRVIVLHRERDKRINKHSDWHGKRRLLLLLLEYNTSHKPHVFQTDSRHTTGYDATTRVRNGSVHTPLRVVVLPQVALESGRYTGARWLLTASVSVSVWVWVIWRITNRRHLEVWWFLIQQHFRVQILLIHNSADFLWENGWFLILWCGDVALLFTCWIINHHTSNMTIRNSAGK